MFKLGSDVWYLTTNALPYRDKCMHNTYITLYPLLVHFTNEQTQSGIVLLVRSEAMSSLPVGINYEGGKIVQYAEQCPQCLGYVNAQIAMDAPFHEQVADETVRITGRSEKSMDGYDETKMLSEINSVIKTVRTFLVNCTAQHEVEPLTLIQIARGRSAADTISLISPLLVANLITRYSIASGYKSFSYFQYPTEPFVLLNIGMFGRLTHVDAIAPGTVFNPTHTFEVVRRQPSCANDSDPSTLTLALQSTAPRTHINSKNLVCTSTFPSLVLLGIDDAMPFVTPAVYDKEEVYRLVDLVVAQVE